MTASKAHDIVLDYLPRIESIAHEVMNGYSRFGQRIRLEYYVCPEGGGQQLRLTIPVKLRKKFKSYKQQSNKEFKVKELIRRAFPEWSREYIIFEYIE